MNLYFKRIFPFLLSVIFLTASVLISMEINRLPNLSSASTSEQEDAVSKEEPSIQPASESEQKISEPEMRAVWVPYMSLDMRNTDMSETTFQKKFDEIISTAQEKGMNALIVHVRPFGDALYPSEYFPWSHLLTGTQGVNPGYDPLEYMVQAAHEAGMEIHAWINPLRIQTSETPEVLSQNNPYSVWQRDEEKKNWTVDLSTGKYYNPAYEEVRNLIAAGVREIVKNYDVDGIQFDDYFYPTEDPSFDQDAYQNYLTEMGNETTAMELTEWRRANINALVSLVYAEIKAEKPDVIFGISPQGNIENDMKMGADVYSWCEAAGYVDYICPQLYFNFDNPVLPFDQGGAWQERRH